MNGIGEQKGGPDLQTYLKIILVASSIVWGYATLSTEFSGVKDQLSRVIAVQNIQGDVQRAMNERLIRIERDAENERERTVRRR